MTEVMFQAMAKMSKAKLPVQVFAGGTSFVGILAAVASDGNPIDTGAVYGVELVEAMVGGRESAWYEPMVTYIDLGAIAAFERVSVSPEVLAMMREIADCFAENKQPPQRFEIRAPAPPSPLTPEDLAELERATGIPTPTPVDDTGRSGAW